MRSLEWDVGLALAVLFVVRWRFLSLLIFAMLGVAALSGCIGSRGQNGPQLDAKGFGGEEEKRKAARNSLVWLLTQLRNAGARNFHFASEALEYRGSDAALKARVQSLRGNSTAFGDVQKLLAAMMSEGTFLRLAKNLAVDAASDEGMANLGAPAAATVLSGATLWFRAEDMKAQSDDPRGLLVHFVAHYLRQYGFGPDGERVRLEAGYGESSAPPVSIPSSLLAWSSLETRYALATVLVLLAQDFRFGLAGDAPDNGITWSPVFRDDFGGIGGDTIAAASLSSSRWDWSSASVPKQQNGFFVPLADWRYFVFAKEEVDDFRVVADVVFGETSWAGEGVYFHYRQPSEPPMNGQVPGTIYLWRHYVYDFEIAARKGDGTLGCAADVPSDDYDGDVRFELSASVVGSTVVVRVNGRAACTYTETSYLDPGGLAMRTRGVKVDSVRVDRAE